MLQSAIVKIWDTTVGAIVWDQQSQTGTFEYTKKYAETGWELSPIKMPLHTGQHIYSFPELNTSKDIIHTTFKGLPGLIADVLPDRFGNEIIHYWLQQNGRTIDNINPIELLCFIGNRGMGALTFEPATIAPSQHTFNIEIESLVQAARQILERKEKLNTNLNEDPELSIKDIIKIGTSAGGARPKAVIAYDEVNNQVRSGQTNTPQGYEHWLIKLDGVSDIQVGTTMGYGRVEMAYYLMATACGIDMSPCRLLEENGRAHFMTKRFDRDDNHTRHHIQTWCALEHYDFSNVGIYSYELLFQTMRKLRLPYPAAEQMYRRMIFNILSRNCDDHTKNFSFRMKQGEPWELAPAYDICFSYRPDSIWVSQHSISMNGKRKDFTMEDFLTFAKKMNIKKPQIIIEEISSHINNWIKYAHDTGVSSELTDHIDSLIIKKI